ncbi:3-keto-disaccharide hydrolase [Gimesia aquarii]|uniref:3-keto-alpha-glucoside-1,2-lyase/3-keto-2-hydroxy-glucal hydratase domain-containing protein n=1 Tax=Gimesia aquarii TaxID=2527964 RepID=A0A517W186_9PLAN|nr:DUF1080 domain-containing protein [Gimesia aquarii]QDT99008.1 hypothetical protein V144x_45180 [Gimesia aquarii]
MTRYRVWGLSLAVLAAVCLTGSVQAGEKSGWVNLFDGKTLDGWVQHNGTATYKVKNGTIEGTTSEGSPNSFLCTKKNFGNFELEFEVKVHNKLNSGVQIRSQQKDGNGRVNGPQVEIEASGNNGAEAGYIYGEATGRGWLTPDERRKPHKTLKDGEWNKFKVIANGPRIQTWINGKKIEDLTDEAIYKTHPTGFIGLQVHGIKKGTGPYSVAWKNIRIKTLD